MAIISKSASPTASLATLATQPPAGLRPAGGVGFAEKALLKRESQFSIQRHELSKPQHSTITISNYIDKVASGGSHQNLDWHQEVLVWHQEVQFLANFLHSL